MPFKGEAIDWVALDWIAVDWGTSRLRCWAMSASDTVLASASSARGMGTLLPGDFEPALLECVGDWLTPDSIVPVLCCGMVGARGGWLEAPYREVPCAPAPGTEAVLVESVGTGLAVHILPGLSQVTPPDVMRGEETSVAGLMACGVDSGLVCLPGSHSKWVRLLDGQLTQFSSSLTGEAFSALSQHTVLRLTIASDESEPDAVFAESVKEAVAQPENTLCAVFGLRPSALLDGLNPVAARSRLSGLMIGLELAGVRDYWRGADYVHVIGEPALVARYVAALDVVGTRALGHDPSQLTLLGLAAARQALRSGTCGN